MGFTTVPEALRAAGRAADGAMGELRGVDCAGPVSQVAAALPGGNAAGAASSFGNSFKTTFSGWCNEADQQAQSLAKAADAYQRTDHAAAISLPDPGKLTGPR
jgi:hypothetical protein